MNLIIRILVYPHMRRSAESSSCRASLSFQKKKPPLHSPVAARISDRAFSISVGSAEENKEVKPMENETIMIDGVRYYLEFYGDPDCDGGLPGSDYCRDRSN